MTAEDVLDPRYRIRTDAKMINPGTGYRVRHIDADPGVARSERLPIPDGHVGHARARELGRRMHDDLRELTEQAVREGWSRDQYLGEVEIIIQAWTTGRQVR